MLMAIYVILWLSGVLITVILRALLQKYGSIDKLNFDFGQMLVYLFIWPVFFMIYLCVGFYEICDFIFYKITS